MRFSKWHGLGNDYLLVERAELAFPLTPDRVRLVCDYHFGIGSDGILEVLSVTGETAEIVIWNPDGSTAELSGNGVRIVARWLAHRARAEEVRVRVGPREVVAWVRGPHEVEMAMGRADVGRPELVDVGGEQVEVTPVSVGNPHAVIRREPERAELQRLGPLLERHPRFPQRTNVQLVAVSSRHDLRVGVWERGAGETLASGTSSVAASAAAIVRGWCDSPVTVHLAGGDLVVALDRNLEATLIGAAEEICSAELAPEFEGRVRASG